MMFRFRRRLFFFRFHSSVVCMLASFYSHISEVPSSLYKPISFFGIFEAI